MLRGEPGTTVRSGEFAFAYWHQTWVSEVYKEVGARWPSISKQSVTRLVECQSQQLRKEIKREMEEVAKETDIAFTTDFGRAL